MQAGGESGGGQQKRGGPWELPCRDRDHRDWVPGQPGRVVGWANFRLMAGAQNVRALKTPQNPPPITCPIGTKKTEAQEVMFPNVTRHCAEQLEVEALALIRHSWKGLDSD